MSLIPSESYTFPDHYTTTRAASRNPKNIEPEPEPEPVEPPAPKKPTIVALPNPKPRPQPAARVTPAAPARVVERRPEPRKIAPPTPNPALRRASAPPPRIPEAPSRKIALPPGLKPKVRWNNRTPAMDPTAPIANNGNGNGSGNGNGNGAEQIHHEPIPIAPRNNVIPMRAPVPPPSRPTRPPQMIPIPEDFGRPPTPAPTARPAPPVRPENFAPKPVAPVVPAVRSKPLVPKQAAPVPAPKQVPVPKPVPRPAPKPARASSRPTTVPAPRAVAIPSPQEDFFEMFAQNSEAVAIKRRRKERMLRFMVCESITVGILLPLVIIGVVAQPQNAALHWIVNILTISAAVAAALIPILFFALTPTLPEIER